MILSEQVSAVLNGQRIKQVQSGYIPRIPQIQMASAVSDLIQLGGTAVLEAGTGVGKSFAYLLPAVLSRQACVISTATLTLQDQLMNKDIPAVAEILGVKVDAAVLKGRSNYLCLRKLDLWGESLAPGLFQDNSHGDPTLQKLPRAARKKMCGDALDCLRSSCPRIHECHYYRARNLARKATVLVVNHHLLLSGLETGDMIPEAWLLVADEAHALYSAASSTLGHHLTENMLNGVLDAIVLSSADVEKKTVFLEKTREISALVAGLVSAGNESGEVSVAEIQIDLQTAADSSGELRKMLSENDEFAGACVVLSAVEKTAVAIAQADGAEWCCFIEKSGRHPLLKCVPVNPGSQLREKLYSSFPAVLLTSATLASGGSFSYYDSLLGVPEEAEKEIFESPFDYNSRSVLVLSPEESDHNDHKRIAAIAWRVASETASILQGRTMILFTSYRNLELCTQLADAEPVSDLEIHVQGRTSRSEILRRFRKNPRGIILGTASFWEGIDLPGELLQSLIIDRIPFPSPGHPLMKARMDLCQEQGRSSFTGVMIPEAATRLRQGAGRLIRSVTDSGAVFILDRRLVTAGYGPRLLKALPPFRRVSFHEALDFLREHSSDSGSNTIERSENDS